MAAGRSPIDSEEVLTDAQRELERVYLSLRTDTGVSLSAYPANRLTAWVSAGWATIAGGYVRLTPEGWLRLDALVGDLTALHDTV